MSNWNMDGWRELDWQAVEANARDLDSGVGGGGGGFPLAELAVLAGRAEAAAKRLRELASAYV